MNTMRVEITNSKNNQIQIEELNRFKTSQNKDKHPETTNTAQNDAKPNQTTNHNQTPSQITICHNKQKNKHQTIQDHLQITFLKMKNSCMGNTVTPHNSVPKKNRNNLTHKKIQQKQLKTIGKTGTTWTTYNELKQTRM